MESPAARAPGRSRLVGGTDFWSVVSSERTEVSCMPTKDLRYGSARLAARAVMQSRDFDPIEQLMDIYEKLPETDLQSRITIAQGLVPYVFPKLSQVAVVGDADNQVRVTHDIVRQVLANPQSARMALELSTKMEEMLQQAEERLVGSGSTR